MVQHVHFDGLGRTKDDIIICEIGDVFKAKYRIEVSLFFSWPSWPETSEESEAVPSSAQPLTVGGPKPTEHLHSSCKLPLSLPLFILRKDESVKSAPPALYFS